MPESTSHRVLDVGECNPDHHAISSMLTRHFDVEIDRVMFVDDAIEAMQKTRYDLVLVNRLIFDDSSEGLALVTQAKADETLKNVPIMLISNYADAQTKAVAAGAVQGFGKADLGGSAAVDCIAQHLPRKA